MLSLPMQLQHAPLFATGIVAARMLACTFATYNIHLRKMRTGGCSPRIDRNMDHAACNTAYWMLDAIRNTHSAEQHARLLPLELYVDIHLLVTQSLFTYSSLLMRTRCRRGAP